MAGLACVLPGTTEPDSALAFDVVRRAMEKGVLMFAPVGFGMATVKICPPLVIPKDAIEESCDVLEEAFAEAVRGAGGRRVNMPEVLVVGGGMIVHDQILPSLYHMQRLGRVGANYGLRPASGSIAIAGRGRTAAPRFPVNGTLTATLEPFRDASKRLPPRQIVFIAVPDQLHYEFIMAALAHNQHVCTVKPLVLESHQGAEIAAEAERRGLVVAIDYHKRFDDRSLMARRAYREGRFGEFRLGTACLLEKWYYRRSNFQNWMTAENSDAFTYIGCHYVDLVHFITGLLPVAVSVYGIRDRFPNWRRRLSLDRRASHLGEQAHA